VKAEKALRGVGYTVKDCEASGISRNGYYSSLRAGFKASGDGSFQGGGLTRRVLKVEHPFWGYRRVWAWLRHRDKVLVNQSWCGG